MLHIAVDVVLEHDGCVLATAKSKAEAFVRVYEKVSRVTVPQEFRMKKRMNVRLRLDVDGSIYLSDFIRLIVPTS